MKIVLSAPIAIDELNVPLVAFISPVIVALVAVNAPAGLTLKGADAKVSLPNCKPSELALKKLSAEPTSSATLDIVVPVVSRFPLISTSVPITIF